MNKLALTLSLLLLPLLTTFTYAKTVAGYDFGKYPAKVYTGKKASLKLGEWKLFKTRLSDAHKDGTINFAGSYIVEIWGCGTGCISGAMIDKKTGQVYGLPDDNDGLAYDGCYSSDDEHQEDERLQFYPNSRLFIKRSCTQEELSDTTAKQSITYEVYAWHEQHKKFQHLKTVKQNKTVSIDWN